MLFTEYYLVQKKWLHLLPTRTVQKRMGQLRGSINCRRCRIHPEMLAHDINHCTTSMNLIINRHGEILRRLQRAITSELGEKLLEKEIPGNSENKRPDLVILHKEHKKISCGSHGTLCRRA